MTLAKGTSLVRVRLASAEDQATVARMRVAFLEDDDLGHGMASDELQAVTRAFVDEAHGDGSLVSWLADDGDECVGIVSMLVAWAPPRPSDLRSKRAYVINMYVLPSHRRRGLAQVLLDALLEGCRERDLRTLHLYATPAGRPLYERNRFTTNDAWMELPL